MRRTPAQAFTRSCLLLATLAIPAGCAPTKVTHPRPDPLQSALTQATDATSRVAAAEQLAASGETFAAIEQYESARQLGATNARDLVSLAHLYDRASEPEAAAATLDAILQPQQDAAVLRYRSQEYLLLGDFRHAADMLSPLAARWSSTPDDIRQTVVRTLLLDARVRTAEKLLHAVPQTADWLSLAGFAAIVAGRPADAVRPLARAVTLARGDAWNQYLLGWARSLDRDEAGALAAWTAATRLPDTPAQAFIGAARVLTTRGDLVRADEMLNGVQGDDRRLPEYWETAALIASRRGQSVIAQVARGFQAYNSGDPWRAEATWQSALPAASDEVAQQIYAALDNSASKRQDAPAALRYAQAAVQRWPSDAAFHKSTSELLLQQNLLLQARAEAERFAALAPADREAEAADLEARIALDSGNGNLLETAAHRETTLQPNDPRPYLHLAEWQYQRGRDTANLQATLALYRQATAADPRDAEAYARMGVVLNDLNQPQDAVQALLHALTLDSRVLDGLPNAVLAQIYTKLGRRPESAFEQSRYELLRRSKAKWPALLKTLRQPDRTLADWQILGIAALERRDNWVALCAFHRCVTLAPARPDLWYRLAAVHKRLGWFEAALQDVLRAHQASDRT